MNKYLVYSLCVLLSFGLISSCVQDNSRGGNIELASIKVEGIGQQMPVFNVNLGEEIVIAPKVSYGQEGGHKLKYSWSIGTFNEGRKGDLEELSNEPVFRYTFRRGGSYYAHLVLTDGKVGRVVDYQINVNRTFEEGYLMTSKDASGRGNLSFIKLRTPEDIKEGKEPIVLQHCLELINPNAVSEDKLINTVISKVTYPKTLTRLIVAMEDRCYFVDPNTMTILTDIPLGEGFQADVFLADNYAPYAYSSKQQKFVHLDLNYMFPYEYRFYKGQAFEDFYRLPYKGFQGASASTLYVNYSKPEVFQFSYSGKFDGTRALLEGKQIVTTFLGFEQNHRSYVTPLFIMAEDGGNLILYKNETRETTKTENFTLELLAKSDNLAIPPLRSRLYPSVKYSRYFYYIGSKLYVFTLGTSFSLPTKDQFALDFGANEEITTIATDITNERLFVATFDGQSAKGNLYVYDTADVSSDRQGAIQALESYKACADRISNIMYKPKITT